MFREEWNCEWLWHGLINKFETNVPADANTYLWYFFENYKLYYPGCDSLMGVRLIFQNLSEEPL